MSTQPSTSFAFDSYTVRPITEQDRRLLEELIEQDEYHRGRMTPDYFLKLKPGEDAWALEDLKGRIVFYFKTSTAVRMSIQFPAVKEAADKERNRFAMLKGLAWIEAIFRRNGFREVLFDTEGLELANFAKRRLGFSEAPTLLTKPISGESGAGASGTPKRQNGTDGPSEIAPKSVGTLPTGAGESGGQANVRP